MAWPRRTRCATQGLPGDLPVLMIVRGSLWIGKDRNVSRFRQWSVVEVYVQFTQRNQQVNVVAGRISISCSKQFLQRNAGASDDLSWQQIPCSSRYTATVITQVI